MKTKEISFTLPFAIALYEFVFFAPPFGKREEAGTVRRFLYLLPYLLTLPIIPLSMVGSDRPWGGLLSELGEYARETEEMPRDVYLFTQFRVIVDYIRLAVFPAGQNLYHHYALSQSFFEARTVLSFAFLLSIFVFSIWLLRRSRKTSNAYGLIAGFGIMWFFLTLSVESSVIPITDVMYEHRMYLAMFGAASAFGAGAFHAFERAGVKNMAAAGCAFMVFTAAPLAAATFERNLVWRDELTLWEDVVRKSPELDAGHNAVGVVYIKRGRIDEAIEKFAAALRLNPRYAAAHYNLGVAYYHKDMLDSAIGHYTMALEFRPDHAAANNNIGVAYARKGLLDEAIGHFENALKSRPDYPEAYNNLGLVHEKKGLMEEAAGFYRSALELNPQYEEARNGLARVRGGMKR
jgi:tetratricopeptide (TPR) repeat protein